MISHYIYVLVLQKRKPIFLFAHNLCNVFKNNTLSKNIVNSEHTQIHEFIIFNKTYERLSFFKLQTALTLRVSSCLHCLTGCIHSLSRCVGRLSNYPDRLPAYLDCLLGYLDCLSTVISLLDDSPPNNYDHGIKKVVWNFVWLHVYDFYRHVNDISR